MNLAPIRVENIFKAFGNKLVLKDVSLEVLDNEIFGFIGLNGVGKTTLIKIILDLLDADSGQVEIFGVSSILPKARKNICYLPEKFQPSQHFKGEEFVKFVLGFYGKKFDEEKTRQICENLDFPYPALKQKITKYSKGMTQKLGLLALFLSEADLVILDEPMSGLDPKARIALKRELIAYKNLGKTIFFSSHILSDMDEICDAIAVLNNAKITYHGDPQGFKSRHQEDSLDKAFLKEIL
jgi:ABC-2 type transport system ATP-binding protein